MKSSKKPTEFEQNNYDVTSIPGFVIKKNSSRSAKHGPFERRRVYHKANKMLIKARQKKSTDATQRYLHDGTPANRTELRCQPSGGKKKTQCYVKELPWRNISTSQQELREFKVRSIGISRQTRKDLSIHSTNDLTLLQRNENANDCTMSTWQGPRKTTEPLLRQRKGQAFEGMEKYYYAVQLRHRHHIGTEPIGRWAVGIRSIPSKSDDFWKKSQN